MRSTDKLLVTFVTAIVILVVIIFIVEFNQPPATYREGKAPEDVAYNYLFALQHAEYERAYAQLSPQLRNYPDEPQVFIRQVRGRTYIFPLEEDVALSVLEAEIFEDWASVEVKETRFYNDGPFSSRQYSTSFHLELELVEGDWKIVDGDSFFLQCWTERSCSY